MRVLTAMGGTFLALLVVMQARERAQTTLPVDVSPAALQTEYSALQQAKDSYSKAIHSYLLNDAADEYAHQLNEAIRREEKQRPDWHTTKEDTEPEVQTANRYGASLYWCEFDADWTARPEGYLRYLSLWPDGPDAEEAWWRGKLGHRFNNCYDAAGTEEETATFVHDYKEFLQRFPHGKHERDAREALKQFQDDLDWYKQQKKQ